jgi:hypothetical protein
MENRDISRRTVLKDAGAVLAGLTVLSVAGPKHVLRQTTGEVIPWLDQPAPNPIPDYVGNLLRWEALESRLNRYTIMGAAWVAPIAAVDVQIDRGSWMRANTRSGRERLALMAACSPRRGPPSSQAGGLSGRTTVTSTAGVLIP